MTEFTMPLSGIRVLDFAQYLAGPAAALRLADLGADVIKVERPDGGDACRQLVIADQKIDETSLLFHTINRNKRSFAANLKLAEDLEKVKTLIQSADVMIHNFRPNVMERIGLDYKTVADLNPKMIYATVTGYGANGPWRDKPGQDLLVQAMSGLTWLSGDRDQGPVPVGLAVMDIITGQHLIQGILAALVRRGISAQGALVEVDMMSSAMDLQFEQITSFLREANTQPLRSAVANASVHAPAPYGIFPTTDGYLALAMASISQLADLLDCPALQPYADPAMAYRLRDQIKTELQKHLSTQTTRHWLNRLEPADIWCADVFDWPTLFKTEGFQVLDLLQEIGIKSQGVGVESQAVGAESTNSLQTTRCPIRIDGRILKSARGAPVLGEHTKEIMNESTG